MNNDYTAGEMWKTARDLKAKNAACPVAYGVTRTPDSRLHREPYLTHQGMRRTANTSLHCSGRSMFTLTLS
ncbi:hypothetical protein E2C01_099595 [Portunus trituberculatus]|uniref:Uncharacterized protein n=1 Tax=Portunus trituberculatus TaxID=210409 RepID=A0A5B7KAU6_PORTR|nr:hypothetical protein [Portunus trituberculatus]